MMSAFWFTQAEFETMLKEALKKREIADAIRDALRAVPAPEPAVSTEVAALPCGGGSVDESALAALSAELEAKRDQLERLRKDYQKQIEKITEQDQKIAERDQALKREQDTVNNLREQAEKDRAAFDSEKAGLEKALTELQKQNREYQRKNEENRNKAENLQRQLDRMQEILSAQDIQLKKLSAFSDILTVYERYSGLDGKIRSELAGTLPGGEAMSFAAAASQSDNLYRLWEYMKAEWDGMTNESRTVLQEVLALCVRLVNCLYQRPLLRLMTEEQGTMFNDERHSRGPGSSIYSGVIREVCLPGIWNEYQNKAVKKSVVII